MKEYLKYLCQDKVLVTLVILFIIFVMMALAGIIGKIIIGL